MGVIVFLFLVSMIDNVDFSKFWWVGIFFYGFGCCLEFYSGVVIL